MTHDEYHEHVKKHLNESLPNNSGLNIFLQNHLDTCTIILNLNLDSTEEILKPLYCPIERRKPRDPQVMLRSLILMSLLKIGSISDWVDKTRAQKVCAILAGFVPDDTAGIGTYYDFMNRICRRSHYSTKISQIDPTVKLGFFSFIFDKKPFNNR